MATWPKPGEIGRELDDLADKLRSGPLSSLSDDELTELIRSTYWQMLKDYHGAAEHPDAWRRYRAALEEAYDRPDFETPPAARPESETA